MGLTDQQLPSDLRVERLEGDVAVVAHSAIAGGRRTLLRVTGDEAVSVGRRLAAEGLAIRRARPRRAA